MYYQDTYLYNTKYLTFLVLMKGTRPQRDTVQKANGFVTVQTGIMLYLCMFCYKSWRYKHHEHPSEENGKQHLSVRSALDSVMFEFKKGHMKESLNIRLWKMDKIALKKITF